MVNTSSVIDKAEMTQSTSAKHLVGRTMHETVQVAHHAREPLGLGKLSKHIANFIRLDRKHTFGRSTIIAEINAMHCGFSKKSRVNRHNTERSTASSPELVMI